MSSSKIAGQVGAVAGRLVVSGEAPIVSADEVVRRLADAPGEGWMQWTDSIWLRRTGGGWRRMDRDGSVDDDAPRLDGKRWPMDAEFWDADTATALHLRHVDGSWIWTTLRFAEAKQKDATDVLVLEQALIGNWRTKARMDSILRYRTCWRQVVEPGLGGAESEVAVWRPWLSVFTGFDEKSTQRKGGAR